jgi:isopentenyl diphosphate isomerase/L-lactate dehydrogenase-like FMN-dependent dehydrogenase
LKITDYENLAKLKLDKLVYGYFSAGADDEITLANNRRAFL